MAHFLQDSFIKSPKKRRLFLFITFIFFSLLLFCIVFEITKLAQFVTPNPEKEAKNIVILCDNHSTTNESCYRKQFEIVAQKESLEYTLKVLQAVQILDSSTKYCHGIGHEITTTEVNKNPKNWMNVLGRISEFDISGCQGGLVHGVIEGYIAYNPTFRIDEKSLPKICSQIRKVVDYEGMAFRGQQDICYHEFGHLLLVQHYGNVSQSVSVCAKFPSRLQASCDFGVFMENNYAESLSYHGISHPVLLTKQGILAQEKSCQPFSGQALTDCWIQLSHLFLNLTQQDMNALITYCQNGPTEETRDWCYLEGISLNAIFTSQDKVGLAALPSYCDPFFSSEMKFETCIDVISSAVTRMAGKDVSAFMVFCDGMTESHSSTCNMILAANIKKYLDSSDLDLFCKKEALYCKKYTINT